MRIKTFEVVDLLDRPGTIRASFHSDLNILTGKNGAGKTSLLKLLWYVMSGNIIHALNEVPFSKFNLVTDSYECTVYRLSYNTCRVEFTTNNKTWVFEDGQSDDDEDFTNAEDLANPRLIKRGSSVFFPTFRRIEGGFTLTPNRNRRNHTGLFSFGPSRVKSDIEDALTALSKKLTNGTHTFVSSISTADIVGLLLTRFADLSGLYNDIQQKTSEEIISTIKEFKSDKEDVQEIDTANIVIDDIRQKIESMESDREDIMAPMEAVRSLVERLFKHTGINIGTRLSFGDAANSVTSDALSAGEKQMLSFICYNAFNQNSVLIIDEPELSLHVDWQRQLFPMLLAQQSSNQFIIATHSPFIYSKYPDKEVLIDLDRGDSGGI
ncbi:AAA family ATPase [Sphingomonas sp. FUKUSWIS1]|uniref:AAA family ATPase n=1 Tax=Sphingomonas sp. FUKUSWIS1 TaxID=1379701 RepID=UPI0004DF6DEC|nr:ATP-binding protein [Sphingomonas sp. FUKUSWIS1]